jgi:hypothetical protein
MGVEEMKSYILEGIRSVDAGTQALVQLLPYENLTWLLRDAAGNVMAYFYVVEEDELTQQPRAVVADISGRHYNCDAQVIALLKVVQSEVGGKLVYSP